MKIRNPQPDGLIVSFDLDEVFVTGVKNPATVSTTGSVAIETLFEAIST